MCCSAVVHVGLAMARWPSQWPGGPAWLAQPLKAMVHVGLPMAQEAGPIWATERAQPLKPRARTQDLALRVKPGQAWSGLAQIRLGPEARHLAKVWGWA
ncbi:hypothetical protein AMTR_s00013p00167220 [Amborella trichopoda]|uniref:Uncharacterized protein n=1 Tax=Amborella trichopoda TaxID=13333 RepID=W1PPC3_AMBTC|nr:hypothetical protein AMTR_s00013p00167220 [Amborella trichopoda]